MFWLALVSFSLIEPFGTDSANFSRILFLTFSQNFNESLLANQTLLLASDQTVNDTTVALYGHLESSTSVALLTLSLVVDF